MSVSSVTRNQSNYSSSSVTSNQSDHSSSDSSGHIEDNSLDMDHESYASTSYGAKTTGESASSVGSDSKFTSNEDKEHSKVV